MVLKLREMSVEFIQELQGTSYHKTYKLTTDRMEYDK